MKGKTYSAVLLARFVYDNGCTDVVVVEMQPAYSAKELLQAVRDLKGTSVKGLLDEDGFIIDESCICSSGAD